MNAIIQSDIDGSGTELSGLDPGGELKEGHAPSE